MRTLWRWNTEIFIRFLVVGLGFLAITYHITGTNIGTEFKVWNISISLFFAVTAVLLLPVGTFPGDAISAEIGTGNSLDLTDSQRIEGVLVWYSTIAWVSGILAMMLFLPAILTASPFARATLIGSGLALVCFSWLVISKAVKKGKLLDLRGTV